MATQWGTREGTNEERVGVNFRWSPATIVASTATVTVYMDLYMDAKYDTNDTQVLYWKGAAFTDGSKEYHLHQGSYLVETVSFSYTPSHTSTKEISCALSISGHYGGATPTKTGTLSLPARPYSVPSAVTGISASRISTTTNRITWANTAGADDPYTNLYIERSSDGGTVFTALATLTPAIVTYDDTTASPTVSYKYRVRPIGPGGTGSYATSGLTLRAPASAASISVSPSVTTASDGSTTVTKFRVSYTAGTNDANSAFSSIQMDQWDSGSGSWTANVMNTLTANDLGYFDVNSPATDRGFAWRVKYTNTAGSSGVVTSSTYYTTPLAVTGVTATKSGSNINVAWTNPATQESNVEVWKESATPSGTPSWGTAAKIATLAADSTTYTDVAPDTTKYHRYYVVNTRADRKTIPTYSASVVLITAPTSAPTLRGSFVTPGTYYDMDISAVTLEWTHIPVDGTSQTAYELEWKESGAGSWTASGGKTTSSSLSKTFPLNTFANNKTIYWRVRTWGAATTGGSDTTGASPYSGDTAGGFRTAASPSITITSPNTATWPSSSLVVIHSNNMHSSGASQSVVMTKVYAANGTTLLWTQSTSGTSLVETVNYGLANLTTYVIKQKMQNSQGLWSPEVSKTIQIVWETLPSTPSIATSMTAVLHLNTHVDVAWVAPANWASIDGGGTNVNVRIERWNSIDQEWTQVGLIDGSVSGTYADNSILGNSVYQYRVIAEHTKPSNADPNANLMAISEAKTQVGYIYTTPGAPSSLIASMPDGMVFLEWVDTSSYPVDMEIQRKNVTLAGAWATIDTVPAEESMYTDIYTEDGTEYDYRIAAKYGSLYSSWLELDGTITVPQNPSLDYYPINIPPVRRNGPRESRKENIEAAELSNILDRIDDGYTSLMAKFQILDAQMEARVDTRYEDIEASRIQTEI